ncbi:MAG: RdgB/HAM1 family non-canonical purine NTP pyrophosphatase [Gloeobacteraceae cyanobacterium ES-bin-316]|nr:RdgB/HAM1 family non-canonical purine NTP pyrophosphatase [Ferruginibacter sp.]
MKIPSIIFATNNQHKADEIRLVLKERFEIKTLKDAGITIDIPEPYDSLEENAREKSTVIHSLTGSNCFSEDTGLEVDALHGLPGVKSARYAGEDADFKKNIEKLLGEMKGIEFREAQFRTIVSLILEGKEHQFEGICKGHISETEIGENGFGYDAVFIPQGSHKTFAEMTMEEKEIFSHRKKAMEKLIGFLNT